jgi:hypothetical protein
LLVEESPEVLLPPFAAHAAIATHVVSIKLEAIHVRVAIIAVLT